MSLNTNRVLNNNSSSNNNSSNNNNSNSNNKSNDSLTNCNKTTIKWKDVKIGDTMTDGSVVTQIHDTHTAECFKITIGPTNIKDIVINYIKPKAYKTYDEMNDDLERNIKKTKNSKLELKESDNKHDSYRFNDNGKSLIVSEDHLFLVNLSKVNKKLRKDIFDMFRDSQITVEENEFIFADKQLSEEEKDKISDIIVSGNREELRTFEGVDTLFTAKEVSKTEPQIYNEDKNLIWLSALDINALIKNNVRVLCGKNSEIINCEYVGPKECRCISTNTGKYSTKEVNKNHGDYNLDGYDIISHNSVTIRNIIFHCVTHGIKIGLVDLKLTEFTPWKSHENVLGVANSIREACELLRISRNLMYKRNAELAKNGVVDLADYKPKNPTDKIAIFGREYNENEKCVIKDPETGEEKEITIKQLMDMLYS